MASALINNTVQVCFASVLSMDHEGMVSMFEALVASGLSGFLGFSSALFEDALVEFLHNASVRDGLEQTVGTYLTQKQKIYVDEYEPVVEKPERKKKAVSKKRPAPTVESPATNRKKTTGKDTPAGKKLALVTVAQEVVPIQMIAADTPLALKRKIQRRDMEEPSLTRSDDIAFEITERSSAVNDEDDNLDGAENEISRKMASFTAPKQLPQEPLRSGEDDDMSGFKQPTKDVATMTESEDTGSMSKALELTVSTTSDEESISLEDILKQIPADVMLPSVTAAEITRIKFARSIEIRVVHEGDWYKASLPQISTADKGKAPLVEDTIKGHPAREMFSLICADIDFLVQLREKVADVVSFFHSFSLSKLADLGIIAKEKQLLAWAETDSLETVVRRLEFTIAKYREMLLRKFLEFHHQHFQAGQPSTAIDLQIIALLSSAHIFAVETLQTQMRIHGLKWECICSSRLFKGENRDRGAVIARSNTSTRSLCWLRTKIMVDGSWVVQEANDLWLHLRKQTVPLTIELSPQRQFDDTLAPVSEFFKVLHKQWADVCIEVVQFSTVGNLQPVGSHNFCRDIVAISIVIDISVDASDFVGVFRRESVIIDDDVSSNIITISSKLQYIQTRATVVCLSRRKLRFTTNVWTTSCKHIFTAGQPVASTSRPPADVPVASYSESE
ncbi:splicing factor 3B subunit 1-like [Dorcoceras hygrometricum]|uniref:Splicing factor 3B subunit 1-like n=1 Tax=Dorcoceras hygrometricum TaxID=472368 RepID=A0A2Z7DHN7_9LAMI|nr:splicing factor 3B subunit 1-like [Dorcoceras hygrometricum]